MVRGEEGYPLKCEKVSTPLPLKWWIVVNPLKEVFKFKGWFIGLTIRTRAGGNVAELQAISTTQGGGGRGGAFQSLVGKPKKRTENHFMIECSNLCRCVCVCLCSSSSL